VAFGRKKSIFLAVLAGVVLPASAQAAAPFALIQAVHGKVLVNKGDGYQPVSADMAISVGDRLLISQNSDVTLSYVSAGCSSSLSAPAVLKVAAAVPCKTGANGNSATGSTSIGSVSGAATGVPSATEPLNVPSFASTAAGVQAPVIQPVSLP
jgi:hypothetical protein